MLTSLRVENFAIVSELELDFSHGLTAFTGETGAGKSIMIDALFLALGGRADSSVIRNGAEKCEIHARFYIDHAAEPMAWLEQHDVLAADGEIFLRRIIAHDGRSKSYINGQPFPLQKVKELSEMLVDIHGQHQHQRLLHHSTHREQLDQYAAHHSLLEAVALAYREVQGIKQRLEAFNQQDKAHDRLALLQFQYEELSGLHIQENEIAQLHSEHQLLHHARDYLAITNEILLCLNADDAPTIAQQLHSVSQKLMHLPQENKHVRAAIEFINNAMIQCDEASGEIQHFSESVQLDPERLFVIEQRLDTLHQMARKYHVDMTQLMAHTMQLDQELKQLRNADHERAELELRYIKAKETFAAAAAVLHQSRIHHAERLAADITASIRLLGMPHGTVHVVLSPLEGIHVHGADRVEYQVCTNPGLLPDTLAKIVSGGELSRISLAIQMITAQRGATPTLLFDEVDVGIGGATAALVGKLLRSLGERLQVFCVTHQPQVAACAHHHIMVEKYTENEQTFSRVKCLNEQARVDEVARMLGGLVVTDQSRSHAQELLQMTI